MPTRIDLPPDLEAFTRACVTSGGYSDTGDVIRTALRELQDAESRRATFNAMLDETRQEVTRNGTHDIDDVLAELDAIIEAAVGDQISRGGTRRRNTRSDSPIAD